EVVSADFTATAGNTMTNIVRAGEVPYVMDFGAHRIAANPAPVQEDSASQVSQSEVMRIIISVGGAIGVVIFMSLLGFLIYLIGYRGRLRREIQQQAQADAYYQRPPTATGTGSMPRVTDTGEFRRK
ncbi:MAG TPA: hypothetical protein VHL11_18315, partial [Phototrophicaceae bacterium]|nr:hypothetical protein [Phototrophicaceae bacterium]